ncbi:MAG: hypothetical protein AAGJ56_04670 [Myxococcota bacterium]
MKDGIDIRFVFGVAAILTAVVVLYFIILPPSVPRSDVPRETSVPRTRVPEVGVLVAAQGGIEVQRSAESWTPLRVGEDVSFGDTLRTDAEGRASIRYGPGIALDVLPDTELGVVRRGDAIRFLVSEGVAIADVRPESEAKVQFTTPREDVVAETTEGTLGVLTGSDGTLQAAAIRGDTSVSAAGESRVVPEGYEVAIRPGQVPPVPTALPRSLLLKVRWPDAATRERRQRITGVTHPGTRVRVGESVVKADESGRFEAVVQLSEGVNTIGVIALDAAGRQRSERSPPIELDTQGPTATVETDPTMWE